MRYPIPISWQEVKILRSGMPKILANSFPKAGTNLLKRFVNLLPCVIPRYTYHIDHSVVGWERQLVTVRAGQAVTAHLKYDPSLVLDLKQSGFKFLFIIRDPRDIVVSNAFYIAQKDKYHRLHNYYRSLSGKDEWIMAGIMGIPGDRLSDGVRSKGLAEHLDDFLPWLDEKSCLCLRYEDLIGARGGGSDATQLYWTKRIIDHLELNLTNHQIEQIACNLFYVGARTFRKGMIGDWRNHLTQEHKAALKATCQEALIRLGYVADDKW